jgi:hypothetical protein
MVTDNGHIALLSGTRAELPVLLRPMDERLVDAPPLV